MTVFLGQEPSAGGIGFREESRIETGAQGEVEGLWNRRWEVGSQESERAPLGVDARKLSAWRKPQGQPLHWDES